MSQYIEVCGPWQIFLGSDTLPYSNAPVGGLNKHCCVISKNDQTCRIAQYSAAIQNESYYIMFRFTYILCMITHSSIL